MRQSLEDRSPAPQIDKLAAARGALVGFAFASVLWGLIALAWWFL